jgi:surface antigen
MGNATNWSAGLLAAGWRMGPARIGAVGVSHSGSMGHVVYVVGVDATGVLISEMNYVGFNAVDQRYANVGEFTYLYQ